MSQFIEMFKESPITKVEDIIKTQSGGTPNTKRSEYYGGNIPWLTSGEINQGYINNTEKSITQEGLENSSAKWVPKGSVVIAMYGATAGKVGFLNIPLTTNQAVCALLPCDSYNPIYLYYAVSQKTEWMISQCRGAAQPNISQGIIRSMELPCPPMVDQMKFVTIAEQADKSGFAERKSQFIEMFGQSPLINDMNECFSVIRNGANIKQGQIEGGIPITRIETISEEIVDRAKMGYAGIIDDKYKPYYLQNNDILISHINSLKHIGKCALYSQTGNETIIHGMKTITSAFLVVMRVIRFMTALMWIPIYLEE